MIVHIENNGDLNVYLYALGELEYEIRSAENSRDLLLAEINQRHEHDTAAKRQEIRAIRNAIEQYAQKNLSANGSVHVKFGDVRKKTIRKLYINSIEAAVCALKHLNLAHYIKRTEEPDREALLLLEPDLLSKLGCRSRTKEEITITTTGGK
jgi:phage host-nuclease inhibitor protein Gam